MKTIIKYTLFSAAITSSHAASIGGGSAVNFNGSAPDTLILGVGGSALTTGYYGVGFFNNTDAEVSVFATLQDFTSLNSAFVQLAFDDFATGVPSIIGIAAVPGLTAISNASFAPTPGLTRTIYTYITDSASLGGSGSYALYRHTGIVLTPDPANPPENEYTATISGGQLLIGTFQGSRSVTINGNPVTVNESIMLVPEPSTLLLSAFGVLGLLRRKR